MQIYRLLMTVILLSGCTSSNVPTQYYLMNPVSDAETVSQADIELTIGPVLVADYLQRKGIADRRTQHQLHFSSSHLWAAPLQQQLPMLLRQSLQDMLPNAKLTSFPSNLPVANNSTKQLLVELLKFDGQMGETVQILAHWVILDRRSRNIIVQGVFEDSQRTEDNSYSALVATHNHLFNQFGRQLAVTLVQKLN